MDIKSNQKNSSKNPGVVVSFIDMISKNMIWIAVAIVSIVLIEALSTIPPEPPKPIYDCSSISAETQTQLTTTVNSRLELIKTAMNSSLTAGQTERADMRETIEQIMADTRKEFCKPPTKD